MKTTPIAITALLISACTQHTETSAGAASPPESPGSGRSVPQEPGDPQPTAKPAPGATEDALQTSLDYYDGDEKRTVWVSSDLVAEFAPSDAGRDVLLRADPQAHEEPQAQKGVRIWRVHAPNGVDELVRALNAPTVRLSPVLHDGPVAGQPLRALPGGVVVTFPAGWDRPRIDAWLAARKLAIESEVVASANMYLIATPPGLEAIRIANELHATGELAGATPNFWQQMSAR